MSGPGLGSGYWIPLTGMAQTKVRVYWTHPDGSDRFNPLQLPFKPVKKKARRLRRLSRDRLLTEEIE